MGAVVNQQVRPSDNVTRSARLYYRLRHRLSWPTLIVVSLSPYKKNNTATEPRIIPANFFPDRSRNNQHYVPICTTPLFYILAPTCFGSSLPSSGSVLDPFELLEIRIEWVVYHIMCGYVACVPVCRGSLRNHYIPAPRH